MSADENNLFLSIIHDKTVILYPGIYCFIKDSISLFLIIKLISKDSLSINAENYSHSNIRIIIIHI